jgi:serine/threonine-protein kinase
MATVHLGRLLGPVGFSRTVAIKRLHAQFAKDQDFVAMFLDEARLAGRIQHPNVVQTLDVVANDHELFLVMEYLQGESLSRLWRSALAADDGEASSGMPPSIVSAIVSGMLHGLNAVHEARDERGNPLGIVHRDISPQNVLVGIDGAARVLDFGVAKAAGRVQQTREGQLKGKLPYMAPEQLTGGANVTRQTDIYSAAVVLWECLTGRRLFDDENEARIFGRVLDGYVPPPSQFRPGLPAALDGVVLRGLDRDPARRFSSAREMALALEACVRSAASAEVGSWVEHLASAALNKRAQQVADLESSSAVKVPVRPEMLQALAAGGSHAFNLGMAATYPALEPQPTAGFALQAADEIDRNLPTRIERLEPIAPLPSSAPYLGPPAAATDVTRSWTHHTGGGATAISTVGPAPASLWTKALVAIASAALVVALIAAFFAMRGSLVLSRMPVAATTPPPPTIATATGATTSATTAASVTSDDVRPAAPTTPTVTATPLATAEKPPAATTTSTSKPAAAARLAAAPTANAGARASTAAAPTSKPRATSSKPDPCAIPYTRDDKGVKIYKPECL